MSGQTAISSQNSFTDRITGMVTIIVPIFDARNYLHECLQSVAVQTYSNFEVLMVNDGSRDGSEAICMEFAHSDNRFRLINRENRGVSAARNTGIDQARGEFIYFLDADDMMHPEALAVLIKALQDTNADMVVGGFEMGVSPDFKPVAHESILRSLRVYDSRTLLEKGLYQSLMVNASWGILFRHTIFEGGIRFSEGRRYEDLDIFYKLILESGKIVYLPEKLYFYRQHSDSFINRVTPARFDVLDVTDEMLEYMISLGSPALEKAARDRRFSAHFNIWTLLLTNGLDMPEVEYRCREVIRRERVGELTNPRVRLKNKLGALASFGGKRLVRLLAKFIG